VKLGHFLNHFLLKSALILTGLFTLSIALIRAQPYDNQELRTFLMPPHDCMSPCWQGIRPGETNVFGVMDLLKANKWVSTIHFQNYSTFSNGYIRWNWSGLRPSMISSTGATNLWFDDNITQDFYVETQIHFGDVWLLLGQPDWMNIYRMNDRIRIDGAYKDQVLMVTFEIPCSQSLSHFWLARTDVAWVKELPVASESSNHSDKFIATCRH
jgi:hypothetical protein